MKLLKITLLLLFLIVSMGFVSAQDSVNDTLETDIPITEGIGSFSELENSINNANDTLEITKDYKNDNYTNGIRIARDNLVINGNNHAVDGNNQRIFYIKSSNITINNLVFKNAHWSNGGAIYNNGTLTLNNVTFINNAADKNGGAIYNLGVMKAYDSVFIDNSAIYGGAICNVYGGDLFISNAVFSSKISDKTGQIHCYNSDMSIINSTFLNITSSYSPAAYIESSKVFISNSSFINLTANISAGAMAIKEGGNYYIEGCEFINTHSSRNAGALNIDISGCYGAEGDVVIKDTLFEGTYSDFGGALIQLGGNLLVDNSDFINNGATYNGGSIYISHVVAEINKCTFDSNGIKALENITTCGSAIYCDMSNMTLNNSRVINKSIGLDSAVYACDSAYAIVNSIFMDNINAIYTDFDISSNLVGNVYNNAGVSLNNAYPLKTIMVGEGMDLKLLNNTINVTNLPSRFDLRDWNWTAHVKDQGLMGACWAFNAIEASESALRKAYGITTLFSINNLQKTMIRYSNYGIDFKDSSFQGSMESADISTAAAYLVSWLGVFPQDYDMFDEVGKISRIITTDENIHIQDVIFVWNDEPGSAQMKSVILKYGSLDAGIYAESEYGPYVNPETNAQYVNDNISMNHAVAIVGWDDNYPKENFLVAPPGDGAWIIKNTWGTDWGDGGYIYLSYYDKSLLRDYVGNDCYNRRAIGVIAENAINYNKNYQYDVGWIWYFVEGINITYANVFEALDDDLIAAVGTYFEDCNVDYRVDVYVNGELKLTQNGSSSYVGFHTIKLDEYIPIKRGDVFSAVITSNAIPIILLSESRLHYTPGLSYGAENGNWTDLYDEGGIACLKVYTVADDSKIIDNRDFQVDYGSESSFSVRVVTADGHAVVGADVNFTINGKAITSKTDKNGMAKIKITQVPGKYAIKTIFNGKTYANKITVKQVLTASKITVKKTSKKFTLKAKLKINGKVVKGKTIIFKFKGKTYKVKTNSKGIAQKTFNKNFIKKLKKGKTYSFKVTYIKDTIKSTVKVIN